MTKYGRRGRARGDCDRREEGPRVLRCERSLAQGMHAREPVRVRTCGHRPFEGEEEEVQLSGLITRKGVERLGQSVFIMRERDTEELMHLLRTLRVPFREEIIWVRF